MKTEPGKVTALNPRGIPPSNQLIPMAPRPDSLGGKTIFLIDDTLPSADHFLHQIANWFSNNMANVKTEYRVKAGGLADDDPKLWAEVKAKGNAAIMAIGHCGQAGETYMGALGNTLNYNSVIVSENEKDSPWTPFHVQKGFKPEENVVSAFVGLGIQQGQGGAGLGAKPVPMYDDAFRYNVGAFAPLFGVLVVMDPLVAKGLVSLGYDNKEKLAEWMQKNATMSVKDAESSLFGTRWIGPNAATLPDDTQVPRYAKPESFNFVGGGQTNPYHMVANMSYRTSVSIDKWM